MIINLTNYTDGDNKPDQLYKGLNEQKLNEQKIQLRNKELYKGLNEQKRQLRNKIYTELYDSQSMFDVRE